MDTTVWLDFYQLASYKKEWLSQVADATEILIATEQVKMEFLKNRREIIARSLETYKHPVLPNPVFTRTEAVLNAKKAADAAISRYMKALKTVSTRYVEDPEAKDEIYQTAMKVFECVPLATNLNRKNDGRRKIRRLAQKRWCLGYPPRKNNDTSIGDAVNWEWIVDCAARLHKDVIIVSRDSDYGETFGTKKVIKDWLRLEFAERTRREVELTESLSDALSKAGKTITATEKKAENAILARRRPSILDLYDNPEWQRIMANSERVKRQVDDQFGPLLETMKELQRRMFFGQDGSEESAEDDNEDIGDGS